MRLVLILMALVCAKANAGDETWTVNGHTFDSKGVAIRYVIGSGQKAIGMTVTHTQCEIVTQNLTLKKCPKNKAVFGNMPYTPPVVP